LLLTFSRIIAYLPAFFADNYAAAFNLFVGWMASAHTVQNESGQRHMQKTADLDNL